MTINPDKKLVVVTGASSGIGEAIVKKFSALGYPTLLLARSIEKMQSFNLPNSLAIQLDVRNKEAFEEAIKKGEDKFGEVDLLINNAGIMGLSEKMWEQNKIQYEEMFATNVLGYLYGLQILLPKMIKRQGGTVMNVSSTAGKKLYPDHNVYCATKAAVHAFSEATRVEASENNVRIITIAPGAVDTNILCYTKDQKAAEKKRQGDKGKILTVEPIVNAVVYAYQQPQEVCIREIVVTHTKQAN
ncbi:NADP-dependent short-chain dehydrogenase [Candidatus Hepatincolaceae symbiont of Richtersius coronifer]